MRINTNIASLNAQANGTNTNLKLSSSLEKLSSGLRINKAADDASGMAIADKLRTQASSIGQGIQNANSGSALIQIADAAMGEQSNILDIVKTKLIQASTSTTSSEGREAIRKDVQKLLEQLDNISGQTNYNGVNLLDTKGSEFSFQVGEDASFDIGLTTAYSVNTAGLGSAGTDGSTTATIKLTGASFELEGEVSDTHVTVKSSAGTITFAPSATQVAGEISVKLDAKNVTGFAAATTNIDGIVTLSTTNADLKSFLDTEASISTADALLKISDGTYQLIAANDTGNYTFSNGQLFDVSDLVVSGINSLSAGAGESFMIKTAESVDIQKLSGAADLTVTGSSMTVSTFGDSADGIDWGALTSISVQEGTAAIKAEVSTTNDYVSINTVEATTSSEAGNLEFTVSSDDLVKSMSLKNTDGASILLSTTDSGTAQALKDAGLTENANGDFVWSAGGVSANELDFGTGVDMRSLSFSGVSKNTLSNDEIFIETAGTVTVANNKSDGMKASASAISLSITTSAGGVDTTGFVAGAIESGLASSNLQGLLALGEGDLTSETANNFMSVIDDAMSQLNTVRSDFGSTQNQLAVATRNMMTTQVNLKAAESIIRDVDYAAESASFNKQNIIAQAGTYAMSQANAMQQNVLRLLQ